MKLFYIVIFMPMMMFASVKSDFYLWQRTHTDSVKNAVDDFYKNSSGYLYFLAAEFENDGKIIPVKQSSSIKFERSVPVFRIHIKHIKKSAALLVDEICRAYAPYKTAKALQIDLDAPESKIDYYCELMLELRKKLPDVKLSATVLPCHLKHTKKFTELAKACDFYVLQVHGLTKESGIWSIYDHKTAQNALAKAKKIALPFKVALPLYCNILSQKLLVKPDLYKVAELAVQCPEIIVFRLGNKDDGQSLDFDNAVKICNGKYSPELRFHWQKQNDFLWYLSIENCGFFAEKVTLELEYDKESVADMDTFNYAILNSNKLSIILPPSGTCRKFLWVRTKNKQNIENIIRIKEEK